MEMLLLFFFSCKCAVSDLRCFVLDIVTIVSGLLFIILFLALGPHILSDDLFNNKHIGLIFLPVVCILPNLFLWIKYRSYHLEYIDQRSKDCREMFENNRRALLAFRSWQIKFCLGKKIQESRKNKRRERKHNKNTN